MKITKRSKDHELDILQAVVQVAEKLTDLEYMKSEELLTENRQTVFGKSEEGSELTLSHGFPGYLLLYGKIMEHSENKTHWREEANRTLEYLAKAINNGDVESASVFTGLSGIGYAALAVSENRTQYRRMIESINGYVAKCMEEFIERILQANGVSPMYYDAIYGLTGMLNYLSIFMTDQGYDDIIRNGALSLIKMTKNIDVNGHSVPGWYIPSGLQFSKIEADNYKNGGFNTSLSHGIAGPLCVLSKLLLMGINIPGQVDAIKRMIDFLMTYKQVIKGQITWKGQIDFEEYIQGYPDERNTIRRDAWCYGAPGICYALVLAGKSVDDKELIEEIIIILKNILSDIQGIWSPTFCHGYAGILQTLNSIDRTLSTDHFPREREVLKSKIIGHYVSESAFGFANIDWSENDHDLKEFNTGGLLDGATGTWLALFEDEYPDDSCWKEAFLLV